MTDQYDSEEWGEYVPSNTKPKYKNKRVPQSRDAKRQYEEPDTSPQ